MSRTQKLPKPRLPLPPPGQVHQDKRTKRRRNRKTLKQEAIQQSMEGNNDYLV